MPTLKAGDAVRYKALAGDLYDAKVVGVPEPGFVSINITCHPKRPEDILFLSRVAVDRNARGAVWPKERK